MQAFPMIKCKSKNDTSYSSNFQECQFTNAICQNPFEMKILKFLESLWKPLTALLPCLIVLECTTYSLKTRMKTHGTSKFVPSYLHSQHVLTFQMF